MIFQSNLTYNDIVVRCLFSSLKFMNEFLSPFYDRLGVGCFFFMFLIPFDLSCCNQEKSYYVRNIHKKSTVFDLNIIFSVHSYVYG